MGRWLDAKASPAQFCTVAFAFGKPKRCDVAVTDLDIDALERGLFGKDPERLRTVYAAFAEGDAYHHRLPADHDDRVILEVRAYRIRGHIPDRFDGLLPYEHRVSRVDVRSDVLTVHLADDLQYVVGSFIFANTL